MLYTIYLSILTLVSTSPLLMNFGEVGNTTDWRILNDDVMGGRSTATLENFQDYILFQGSTSLENNGGFASFRSQWSEIDFSSFSEVEIRYKSSGRDFVLTLEDQYRYYRPYYRVDCPASEEWKTISMPLTDMIQTSLGRDTGKTLDVNNLNENVRLGIMVFDKKAGPFEIKIDYIKFNSSSS